MTDNKSAWIVGALVIGLVLGYLVGVNQPASMSDHMDMDGAMEDMMSGLEGKTGDGFDKAFLSGMITHHQGAVSMAGAALKNAKHTEIQVLSRAIISAQEKEIADMQAWMKAWYGN